MPNADRIKFKHDLVPAIAGHKRVHIWSQIFSAAESDSELQQQQTALVYILKKTPKTKPIIHEVDAFKLLEKMGKKLCFSIKHMVGLKNCLLPRNPDHSCGPSASSEDSNSIHDRVFDLASLKTSLETVSLANSNQDNIFCDDDVIQSNTSSTKRTQETENLSESDSEEIEYSIRNLFLTSENSSNEQQRDPLSALLAICEQSSPSTFSDVLSHYCDLRSISKVGEGTYGEVFIAGETVCKVVPFNGDSLVNGEQKKAEELLEEITLSLTLNQLRGGDNHVYNVCPTFIRTLGLKVCVGAYDDEMIRAWKEWDKKHESQNDDPSEFIEKQHFVVFLQEHGGQDLESFVLLSFKEAQSLLLQVTVALAVAESAFEFEHRDLHWGNILLIRKDCKTLEFILDGKKMHVTTHGIKASIIDFTLSRINTGEDILFLDLSLDPVVFEGPKGDEQSETYRKMKEVTEDCWKESFPKTNVLWLQYLIDVLLRKKVYDRTSKDTRVLRSLKKRLNDYGSAKESIVDPFFSDLIVYEL